jgi:hypothetical protein
LAGAGLTWSAQSTEPAIKGTDRMTSFRLRRAVAVLFAWLLTSLGLAAAEPWSDAGSGLRVNPPPGYAVHPMSPTPPFAVRVAVTQPDDRDTGCQVTFEALPENAILSQAQINQIASKPDWRERARRSVAAFSYVMDVQPYYQSGITGLTLVADMKATLEAPDWDKASRHFMAILETPKGRTTIACTAEKENFDSRRAKFLDVVRGVEPPRP